MWASILGYCLFCTFIVLMEFRNDFPDPDKWDWTIAIIGSILLGWLIVPYWTVLKLIR